MLKLILNILVASAIIVGSAVILIWVVARIHKRDLEALRHKATRAIIEYEHLQGALLCYAVGKPKPIWDSWIQLHALLSDYGQMENRMRRLLYPIPVRWLWGFIP